MKVFPDINQSIKTWKLYFIFISTSTSRPFLSWNTHFLRHKVLRRTTSLLRDVDRFWGSGEDIIIGDMITAVNMQSLGFAGNPIAALHPNITLLWRSSGMTSFREHLERAVERRSAAKRQRVIGRSRTPSAESRVQPMRSPAEPRVHSSRPTVTVVPPPSPSVPPVPRIADSAREMLRGFQASLEDWATTIDAHVDEATNLAAEVLQALDGEKRRADDTLNALEAEKRRADDVLKALEAEKRRADDALTALVAEKRAAADERKSHVEELARVIPTYKRSGGFVRDAEAYAQEHIDNLVTTWLATEAGKERLAEESAVAYQLGKYVMQHDLYTNLRQKGDIFDPVALGLPAEMENPDPEVHKQTTDALEGGEAAAIAPFSLLPLYRSDEPVVTVPSSRAISPTLLNLSFPETMDEVDEVTLAASIIIELKPAVAPDMNK